jgi:hypothetical protein
MKNETRREKQQSNGKIMEIRKQDFRKDWKGSRLLSSGYKEPFPLG